MKGKECEHAKDCRCYPCQISNLTAALAEETAARKKAEAMVLEVVETGCAAEGCGKRIVEHECPHKVSAITARAEAAESRAESLASRLGESEKAWEIGSKDRVRLKAEEIRLGARLQEEREANRSLASRLAEKEKDRQYHMDQINRMAEAIGMLGETSEKIADAILSRVARLACVVPVYEATESRLAEVERERDFWMEARESMEKQFTELHGTLAAQSRLLDKAREAIDDILKNCCDHGGSRHFTEYSELLAQLPVTPAPVEEKNL